VFESDVLVFVSDDRDLSVVHRTSGPVEASAQELGVARWVWTNRKQAGLSTNTLPGSPGLFIPLATTHGLLGVLGVVPRDPSRFDDPEERRFLEAFAAQMGVAVERTQLSEQAQTARLDAEREQLRSALLSSVSHDLRTPLGVIEGASSALLDAEVSLDTPTRRDLAQTIHEEAERLNRRVRNLLDMTRLEAGAVRLDYEWQSLEEVVGAALARVESRLGGRKVTVSLPRALPLVLCDGILIEQVLVNLLENAIKYSPPDSPIEVSGRDAASEVVLAVADHGAGIAPGEEDRIFEKFYRSERNRSTGGVGLGLAICRAIVSAHGGRIWAENGDGGGAAFRFSLPRGGESASLPPREEEEP
jgi:two-component system sensor histidine kinase KdpD